MYAGENVRYFNEGSGDAVFSCNEMGILNINLNNVSLGDNFDEDDPNTIILIKRLAWHMKFEKRSYVKN